MIYAIRSDGIKFSVRSALNHVDAGRVVAKALADYGNGGGHPAMAGGFIPKKNMEKLEPDRDYKLEMLFLEQIKTEEGR